MLNFKRLEEIENEYDTNSEKIEELKREILLFDNRLTKLGGQAVKVDIKGLRKRKTELEGKKKEISI